LRTFHGQGNDNRYDLADDIKITPYHPQQRCTVASVAGHSMYERETPYFEHALGGTLDMSACHYEQHDPRTARSTGARWIPAKDCA